MIGRGEGGAVQGWGREAHPPQTASNKKVVKSPPAKKEPVEGQCAVSTS